MELEGLVTGNHEFKIFTGLLKASKSADGKMRLHGVASSTTKDLHGDRMLASAIDDMEAAANRNLTIFLNHSYNVPEDVGGSVEKAHSMIRGVDDEGNPNVDLHFDVVMNEANPRAVQTWEAIERGTKLGLSIGAMIPDGGAKRTKSGSYIIEHVDLLETSIVGIPANPRSWVEYAVKSISKAGKDRSATVPLGQPTLTLNNNEYTIKGTLDDTTVLFDATAPDLTDGVEPEVTDSAEPEAVEPEVTDAAPADTAPVEPEVQDAQVTIIQIDTSDGDSGAAADAPSSSQEAPQSGPENGDAGLLDETADGDDAALGDTVTNSVDDLPVVNTITETLNLLRETTRELIEAKKALVEMEKAKEAAEVEKNRMKLERDHVLKATQEILDRVANTPLARRAVAVDAQRSFRQRFEGIYSESLLDMLERNNNG